MFLGSLAKTCEDLGLMPASQDFSVALESILSATSHTNTMMWIGMMENCPLDLPGQGQLLKHGNVLLSSLRGKNERKWSTGSQKPSSCYLILFQKNLLLCKARDNNEVPESPHLVYSKHFR